jgi:type IV pilus assembly protein PilO
MNLSTINWDLEHAGSWPAAVKAGIIFLLCLVLVGLWYYFDSEAQLARLKASESTEKELRSNFEIRYRKAVNLGEYRKQMEEIENTFGDLLRQLPDKTEVPELLVDVSQTGLTSGLEFELFKPGPEATKEFYAELPIEIKVIGNYPDFGNFASGLASLPRIVTIHNVKIGQNTNRDAAGKKAAKYPLVMSALVKTYRYLENEKGKPAAAKNTPAPAKAP